jgi:hypothetical protein
MAMSATALVQGGGVRQVAIDSYVLDTLMRDLVGHDRQPSAYLVYLYLWFCTSEDDGRSAVVSLQDIAQGTGLSKRAVQDALSRLHRRKLLRIQREGITAIPEYTVLRPWAGKT